MKNNNYYAAISMLQELQDLNAKKYNSYVLLSIYTDLENAYKQIGDFENAYRYSSKRIALMNAFNS